MAAVKIRIILCVCLAVCLTTLGVSGFMLYNDYAQRQNDQNAFEQLDETTKATNDEKYSRRSSKRKSIPKTSSTAFCRPPLSFIPTIILSVTVSVLYGR